MQIPIIKGVYTGENADYKTSYPLNMVPVVQVTGISKGYLRPVEGIVAIGSEGPGKSRGAINWNGVHYRVMGNNLCSITETGVITIIGDVGNTTGDTVSMDYSFTILAIASNGKLFYYYPTTVDDSTWTYDLIAEADGFKLIQVTDANLGIALAVLWVDGYFLSTDGEYIVASKLADPTVVPVTNYASSEIDPDPIVNLLKLRNEIYAINRYTIEVFDNVGGSGFPFQRVNGAQIQRGAMGTHCALVYEDTIAFLGGGRKEAPAIYLGVNGQTQKISSREIDEILIGFSEEELSEVVFETLNDKSQAFLWVSLPDRTLVYDLTASQAVGDQVWHVMSSSRLTLSKYRAKDVIFCYDKWQVGDTESSKIGVLDNTISTHFGSTVPWEIYTPIMYNESRGALFKSIELVALTGRAQGFIDPIISTSYSVDGRSWSQERPIKAGKAGNRLKRLVWWRQGHMRNTRVQKFRGDSNSYLAISRIEVDIEPLGA